MEALQYDQPLAYEMLQSPSGVTAVLTKVTHRNLGLTSEALIPPYSGRHINTDIPSNGFLAS